ncbi:MAG: HlyD family efflux transporter periplasmic adaptor subunit [Actinobacteria bacterium]|nr:HlyD family efflux transporter periplasmic adaptor subunit [Actinomycetota bacterium]
MNKILVRIWATVRWIGRHAGLLIAVLVGIGIGYLVFSGPAPDSGGAPVSAAKSSEDQAEEPTTMWTCSMHPEVRLSRPGLCPKCRMKLIPARTTGGDKMSGLREFTISQEAKVLMDIETAVVERKFVTAEIRMVGKVDYDETRLAYITAWIPGRLDKLFVDYTGVEVNKGDHMVSLYSPELLSAQEELLQAHQALKDLEDSDIKIIRETAHATVEAARGKLRLWGLTSQQITQIEERGEVSDHMTIYAPVAGTVIHKNAQEGMYVNTGTRIYTLADLSKVWIKLDAYESDLMWLRPGQKVEFTTVSYPGEIFMGTISFIDPILNPLTRTVKIRVNVPNPQGKLKPQMFVKAIVRAQIAAGGRVMEPDLAGKWTCPMHPSIIEDSAGNCDICEMPLVPIETLGYVSVDPAEVDKPLVIPVSAAMVTGTRAIVYVELPEKDKPSYEGREIVLGPRAGNYYLVRGGLKAGERVVTKGNFKIDSALQIEAKPSMMTPEGGGAAGGHGGMKMKKPAKGDATAKPAMQLPAQFQQQLRTVLTAALNVNKAVKNEDLSEIRASFVGLGQAVQAVDINLLKGHPRMLWKEASMRLGNDAIEGQTVKTPSEFQRAADSLAENINYLRSKFGSALKGISRQTGTPTGDQVHE